MRLYAAFFLALLVGSGCIGPVATPNYQNRTTTVLLGSDAEAEARQPNQFYLVALTGQETIHRISGDESDGRFQCPRSKPFRYDERERTIRYDGSQGPIERSNLTVLVVIDYYGFVVDSAGVKEGCVGQPAIKAYYGRAALAQWLRPDLEIDFTVEPRDGLIIYEQQHFAPMGTKVHVNMTRVAQSEKAKYYITGDFEVVTLGAWDRANLTLPSWANRPPTGPS